MQFTTCNILVLYCSFYLTWASLDLKNLSNMQKRILADSSWRLKLAFFKNYPKITSRTRARAVGIQARQMPMIGIVDSSEEEEESREELTQNETYRHMKHKIFKVMYERVRDSDFKAKRAELVREKYVDDAAFNFGYLFSNVTDRFDLMLQLEAVSVEKYDEWHAFELFNIYVELFFQYLTIEDLRRMSVPYLQLLRKL